MAIYHLNVKVMSRSAGHSAVAAAAYRARGELRDERTGEHHDYRQRGGLTHAEIMTPANAPDWMHTRGALWNAVEAGEKRKDSQLCREVVVALPDELTPAQRLALVRGFVQAEMVGRGMVADVALHSPGREGDQRNHHAHLLLTMRPLGPDGQSFGPKATAWNRPELLDGWRRAWAEHTNAALEQAGHAARVDHRSLKAQGRNQEPTTHLGPVASAMERRGEATDQGDHNRQAQTRNRLRTALERGVAGLAELYRQDHPQEAARAAQGPQSAPEAPSAPQTPPAAPGAPQRPATAAAAALAALRLPEPTSAAVVAAWDTRHRQHVGHTVRRAQARDEQLRQQRRQLADARWLARVQHQRQEPKPPEGLFAAFSRAAHAKAHAAWSAIGARISAWKQQRDADLVRRQAVTQRYAQGSSPETQQRATRLTTREQPTLAARLPEARADLRRQAEAARAQQRETRLPARRDRDLER